MTFKSPTDLPEPPTGAERTKHRKTCLIIFGPAGEDRNEVAGALASRLGWERMNTDHLLQAWFGRDLEAIKQNLGPSSFLQACEQIFRDLNAGHMIITIGDGTMFSRKVLRVLQQKGLLIVLSDTVESVREFEGHAGVGPNPDLSARLKPCDVPAAGYADVCLCTAESSPHECCNRLIKWMYGR